MQVKEFVTSRVETIQAHDTLQHAAEKMRDFDVGSLPVCKGDEVVGIITDRDITTRAVAIGSDPVKALVYEVMTPEVLCCLDTDDVDEAALIMEEHQVRRILVLNESKHVAGIISLGELATAAGDPLLAGKILASVSDPSEYKATEEKNELEKESDGEANNEQNGELSGQTTVTGILHDCDGAKKTIEELKEAGFSGNSILVAMQDESEQQNLADQTQARALATEEVPSLPDLGSGRVLIMVKAEERAADALNILNRNHAVTGGARIPEA